MLGSAAAVTGAAVSMGAGAAFAKFVGSLGSSPRQADKILENRKFTCDGLCDDFTLALKGCFAHGTSFANCTAAEKAHFDIHTGTWRHYS